MQYGCIGAARRLHLLCQNSHLLTAFIYKAFRLSHVCLYGICRILYLFNIILNALRLLQLILNGARRLSASRIDLTHGITNLHNGFAQSVHLLRNILDIGYHVACNAKHFHQKAIGFVLLRPDARELRLVDLFHGDGIDAKINRQHEEQHDANFDVGNLITIEAIN